MSKKWLTKAVEKKLDHCLGETPEIKKGIVVTINTQKGGEAKTTTAKILSRLLELLGYKVCLIDSDPSGNASRHFTSDLEDNSSHTLSNIFRGLPLVPYQVSDNLDIIVGSSELSEVETEIAISQKKVELFRTWLFQNNVKDYYDFIIIDTHNDFGWVTKAMFYATDYVLGVTQPSGDSFKGLLDLTDNLEQFQQEYYDVETGKSKVNYRYGFIATRVDHSTVSKMFLETVRKKEGYLGYIQSRKIFEEANLQRKTIFDLTEDRKYQNKNDGYWEFFKSIIDTLMIVIKQIAK